MRDEYRLAPAPVSDEKADLLLKLDVPEEDIGLPSGDVIGFAHTLRVPAGILMGSELRLQPFHIEFIRDLYNNRNPETGRRIIKHGFLSVARRNGKTLLAGVIVLVHLIGPMRRPNSFLVSAANDREQASVVFRFVADLIRTNRHLDKMLKPVESTKRIAFPKLNSSFKSVSAEAKTKLGFGPDLVIYDEMGSAPRRDLYDALSTSLGSQPEPLMIGISTQAPNDTHFFSQLLDYAVSCTKGEIDDPTFVGHLHATPADAPLMDEASWKLSNPGLGLYRDVTELRSSIHRAITLPSQANAIRNLLLNQRINANQSLFTPELWDRCAEEVDEEAFHEGECVASLDLSKRQDLTSLAIAATWRGKVHCKVVSFTPEHGLDERAERDRADYRKWIERGLIIPCPGKSVSYEMVAGVLVDLMGEYGFTAIRYDRWRMDILQAELAKIGVELPLEPFGQGFKDMSPAIEELEHMVVNELLAHGGDPVLRWAIGNAKVITDAAGNRKLDRNASYGRIDPAVALVMAVGGLIQRVEESFDAAAMIG